MESTGVLVFAVVVLLLVLLALGVHIGFALGLAGIAGMLALLGLRATIANLSLVPYASTAVYSLGVVPMFILMGAVFTRSGFTADSFDVAKKFFGHVKGGLPSASIIACGIFGAVTGSSIANAAIFSRIAIPEMTKAGVDKRLAAGCVAAAGTLASLIPPSLLIVIFGILTDSSIRSLLIAGILPGAVSIIVYLLGIQLAVRLKPSLISTFETSNAQVGGSSPSGSIDGSSLGQRQRRYSWGERLASVRKLWGAAIVFGATLGGIYTGLMTPTQAGAVGATVAFVLAFLPGRNIGVSGAVESLKETGSTTATILTILVGGAFMGRFLGYSGVIKQVNEAMLGWNLPKYGYLAIYILLIVLLGLFLEAFAIMVIVLPVLYPVLIAVGFDPLVLGILTIKAIEIGLITPPIGLNVYVVKGASPVPLSLGEAFAGTAPFILLDALTISLLIAVPEIITYLPTRALAS